MRTLVPALVLAMLGTTQAAVAQTDSCLTTVDQLEQAFLPAGPNDVGSVAQQPAQGQADAQTGLLAGEPGARQGASLSFEQLERVRQAVQDARAAARQGDADGCRQNLAEAQEILRVAGIGSARPWNSQTGAEELDADARAGIAPDLPAIGEDDLFEGSLEDVPFGQDPAGPDILDETLDDTIGAPEVGLD